MSGSAGAQPGTELPLERRKPGDPRPISFTQRRLWYLDQLTPGTGVYNIPYVMRVSGPLNLEAFRQALNAVIGRHEVLRTVFLAPGGNPVPVVLSKWNIELKQFDLRHLTGKEQEAEAGRLVDQEASRPFNFARDLMFRAALIRLSDSESLLVHVSHHIATEFGSTEILYREISPLYAGFVAGNPVTLAEPSLQYSDFALWQTRYLQGERLAELMSYWRQQLTGAAQIDLPADRPRPAVATLRGTRYPMPLSREQLKQIAELSLASGTTPFRGTCAAFNVFLHCWTGQTDLSLGSPVSPKSNRRLEGAVGFFVNTLVLRNDLSGDPTFRQLMSRVNDVVQGAIDHADLTFDKLVEAVKPPREAARMPLFQVNFRILKAPVPALELKDLQVTPPRFVDTHTAKFDLALELEAATGKTGFFEYSTDLFAQDTVSEMARDFEAVLMAVMAEPDVPISQLATVQQISQRVREKRSRR